MKINYKSSGVNIKEADKFVDKIKPLVKKTFSRNVISGIGNFGAFYKIDLRKVLFVNTSLKKFLTFVSSAFFLKDELKKILRIRLIS